MNKVLIFIARYGLSFRLTFEVILSLGLFLLDCVFMFIKLISNSL